MNFISACYLLLTLSSGTVWSFFLRIAESSRISIELNEAQEKTMNVFGAATLIYLLLFVSNYIIPIQSIEWLEYTQVCFIWISIAILIFASCYINILRFRNYVQIKTGGLYSGYQVLIGKKKRKAPKQN